MGLEPLCSKKRRIQHQQTIIHLYMHTHTHTSHTNKFQLDWCPSEVQVIVFYKSY